MLIIRCFIPSDFLEINDLLGEASGRMSYGSFITVNNKRGMLR